MNTLYTPHYNSIGLKSGSEVFRSTTSLNALGFYDTHNRNNVPFLIVFIVIYTPQSNGLIYIS